MALQRITVAVPAALIPPANHVQYLMGKAPGPDNVYTTANYADAQGNEFAVSSGLWDPEQIAGVTNPNIIDEMVDTGRVPPDCDLGLVAQAQASFSFFDFNDYSGPVSPSKITAVLWNSPKEVLGKMDLTQTQTQGEEE